MKDTNKTEAQLIDELNELRKLVGITQDAREYAENIVETVHEPLLMLDAELRVISANRSFYRKYKVAAEETLGRLIFDLGNRQWDIPKLRELLQEIVPQNTFFNAYEVEHDFETIGQRTMMLNARKICSESNKTQMTLLAIEDITDRRKLERALQASHDSLESLVEQRTEQLKDTNEELARLNLVLRAVRNVNQLITQEKDRDRLLNGACEVLTKDRSYFSAWMVLLDEKQRATAVFESGLGASFEPMAEQLRLDGLTRCAKEALGQEELVIIDDPPSKCADCPLALQYSGRAGITIRMEHEGKVYGLITVSASKDYPHGEEERSLLKEVADDIGFALGSIETEGKHRQESERFRLTFEQASIGKVLTAPDGKLIRVNQAFCDLLGYSRTDLESLDFASITHPDDLATSREVVRCLLAKEQPSHRFEKRYLRKDGQPVWTDVSTILLCRPDGSPDHFITHVLDISERKRLQTQVAQSDRLASMGMLAAGVAHEINNPLCYILYNLESLTDDLPRVSEAMRKCLDIVVERVGDSEWARLMGQEQELLNPAMLDDIRARFKDALQGTQRIKDIARGLGVFSRVEESRVVPVALMQVIEVAINMVFNEIKYRARLVKEYGKTSTILANDGRLSQVFLNLLINAAHAIRDGDVESNEIRVRTWQKGDEVFAEVRDTGKGISKEHLPHLFDPFFTTKELGVGTGLGLPISKTIIEGYGGCIDVKSEVGKGTSFVVRLPVRKAAAEQDEEEPATKTLDQPEQRGRILVVDDEAGIRAAMVRMLRGHDVVQAVSGDEARRILEADQAFDLILCDMMMPLMSGVDLHAWLSTSHPELAKQVVFITGGAFTPKAREHLAKVSNIRIEKPFDVANFKKIVGELIVAFRARGS